MSEMKSHVEDGDVAGSPENSPAEQEPMEVRAVSWPPDVSLTLRHGVGRQLCLPLTLRRGS